MFTDWWEKHITPPSNAVDAQLRKDYEHLLGNEYLKAISEKTYKRCSPTRVRGTGLEKYLKQLGRSDDGCPVENLDRLADGSLNTLRDEMRLYLAMLIDLRMSNLSKLGVVGTSSIAGAEKDSVENAQKLIGIIDRMLEGAKDINAAKRIDLKAITVEWFLYSNAHKRDFISPLSTAKPLPEDPRYVELRKKMNVLADQMVKTDNTLKDLWGRPDRGTQKPAR